MLREEIVFGPIRSRRLGASLGINLLPENGKICNFDCIYCECGWNRDGRGDRRLPTEPMLREALSRRLQECRAAGTEIDSITFSGDGEPTLNPQFPEILDTTLSLRDAWYPAAKVSVLSNATTLGRPEVFAALRKADQPILKLDAPTDEAAALINQPAGTYHVADVVAGMARFEGEFILQTMFLKAPGFATGDWVEPWMDIVRQLHPREVMVYTIDRETPAAGLGKYTAEEMRTLVRPLIEEGFNIQIRN